MKSKEYVKKYKLNIPNQKFNHKNFVADLTIDFFSLLEIGNAKDSPKGYQNAVNAIKMKWDGINNKTVGQLPHKLWNYFYATVIGKMQDELFPHIRQQREKKKQQREDRKRQEERMMDDLFDDIFERRQSMFESFFANIMRGVSVSCPTESFSVLDLPIDSDETAVKKSFRRLSLVHHPDKGGNRAKFEHIVNAKNKIISYLKSK